MGWKTSTFFIQRLQTFFSFLSRFLRSLTFFYFFLERFLHLWWLNVWKGKRKTLILSGDFHFRFSTENDVHFRFRFVLGRRWNFIFIGIFVYGREWKMLFGRPLVYITKRSWTWSWSWDAKSWSWSWKKVLITSLIITKQSSVAVAWHLRRGGMFRNLMLSLRVKEVWKSAIISWSYGQDYSGSLFRLDAIAQSVIATATWLAGCLSVTAGIVSKRLNLP